MYYINFSRYVLLTFCICQKENWSRYLLTYIIFCHMPLLFILPAMKFYVIHFAIVVILVILPAMKFSGRPVWDLIHKRWLWIIYGLEHCVILSLSLCQYYVCPNWVRACARNRHNACLCPRQIQCVPIYAFLGCSMFMYTNLIDGQEYHLSCSFMFMKSSN